MNICTHCQTPFLPKKGSTGKFCSKSCAAKYNNKGRVRTTESKIRTSLALRGRPGKNGKTWCDLSQKSCVICDTLFFTSTYNTRKICKNPACLAAISTNKTSRCGSTNSIYWEHPEQGTLRFDSSWEKIIAEKLDELHIKWNRPTVGILWVDSKGKQRYYFPDFYLPIYDLYLDPKNDKLIKKDQVKLLSVKKSINLIYGHPNLLIEHLNRLVSLNGFEPLTSSSPN